METDIDKSGFPMVKVASENFWIHAWPVTKIQFENFLCDEPNSEMDAEWYGKILANNPRLTPSRVSEKNYWQLFIAGVHPEKVQLFAEWNGRGYAIPTASEWFAAYKYFSAQDNLANQLTAKGTDTNNNLLINVIEQKIRTVVMESSKSVPTLADYFLMHRGMVEWVRLIGETGEWGGMGDPNPDSGWNTTSIVKQGRAEIVRNLNVRHYGIRLIKRG